MSQIMIRNFIMGSSNRICSTEKVFQKYLNRSLDKSAQMKINFLISQPKHMLPVLKGTVSMGRFF